MPDQGGLQLLPETRKKITVAIPGENRLLYVGAVVLVIALAGVLGLKFYESSQLALYSEAKAQIEQINQDISKKDNLALIKNIELSGKQLDLADQLLKSHVFWSRGLARLEDLLLPNIQIDSLTLSTTQGEITFKALAPSYTAIAKQISSFVGNDMIVDVTIGEISSQTTGKFEFSMIIKFDKDRFLKVSPTSN
jgi:Tfp pilus assembly protein PilN